MCVCNCTCRAVTLDDSWTSNVRILSYWSTMAFEDFVCAYENARARICLCLHTSFLKNSVGYFETICSFDTWRCFFFNMLYLQRFGSMYFIRHLPFWFWLPWRRLPIVYTFNSWIAYVWVLDIAQIIQIARFVVFIESIVTNLWLTPMCGYLSVFCRVFQ